MGNHFIEIGKSEKTGEYWLSVHTGSRNFGKMVCEYHERIAKELLDTKRKVIFQARLAEAKATMTDKTQLQTVMDNIKKELGINYTTNANGLEYLEGQAAVDYFIDMIFAQYYAEFNRKAIINSITTAMGVNCNEFISSTHNYINFDDMIVRKGAVRSYIGEKLVIPLNMRDGVLICEGKSNPEWNFSAPHGAGRKRSRSDAAKNISLEDFEKTMKGIYSTSVCKATLDEAPQAYRPMEQIISAITPTAIILDRIIPVLNIKDNGKHITWKELREAKKPETKDTKLSMKAQRIHDEKQRNIARRKERKLRGKK